MKRREEERRSEKRTSQKTEDAGARKVEKSQNTVFPMFCGPEGQKVGSLKRAGAEPSGDMRDEKLRRCGAKQNWKSTCPRHHS